MANRLAGTPANGSRTAVLSAPINIVAAAGSAAGASAPAAVIWVDGGDEVLVHLESVQTKMIGGGLLLVSVDLETDQTGRTPLIVRLALAPSDQAAGLVAITDALPTGNGVLAARWGSVLQNAVWAALLGLAQDHATQSGLAPRTIGVTAGQFTLQPGAPPAVVANPGTPS